MMDERLVAMAAEVLALRVDEVRSYCKEVPEIDGFYVWNPLRGGRSMLVAKNGERLVATSAVSYQRHLNDYLAGRRN